ncbi:hypothetical protein FRC02_009265 [Tulasnella sp. 418]|nr:hypothetical protein FRC02_009265 [Tulasnella sp. 418]
MPSHSSPQHFRIPFSSLPQELLLCIIEYSSRTWDPRRVRDLCSFSLVSSDWRHIAQKRLFKEVALYRKSNAEMFLNSIKGRRVLGEATRSLDLLSLCNYRQPGRALPALIKEITELCPRVYAISVDFAHETPRDCLLNIFSPQTFQNLKSLTVTIDSPFPDNNSSPQLTLYDVFDFLKLFNSLKHLNLPGPMEVFIPETITYPSPPSFRLYELVLDVYMCLPEIWELVFQWMLAGENGSDLRILCVDSDCEEEDTLDNAIWAPWLRLHGANLFSLQLALGHGRLEKANTVISDLCPNLRELVLPYANLTPQTRKGLPISSLEHLVLCADAEWPFNSEDEEEGDETAKSVKNARKELSELVDWILKLPRILCVTVCLVDSYNPRFPDIWNRCTLGGIELKISNQEEYVCYIKEVSTGV